MAKPPYMDVAKDVLEKYHPQARCAFVAGSIVRGEGRGSSDIDLVVLYGPEFEKLHRQTIEHQDWLVELFVQNEQAQEFFFERDRERGWPTMAHMVGFGVPIGPDLAYAKIRQERARALFDKGPKPYDKKDVDRCRYFISSCLDDLKDARSPIERLTTLMAFGEEVAEFYLRAKGKWIGSGKHLGRRLQQENSDLANRMEQAFLQAAQGDVAPMADIALEILAPYGGYFQAGHYDEASPDWRDFRPEGAETPLHKP